MCRPAVTISCSPTDDRADEEGCEEMSIQESVKKVYKTMIDNMRMA